MLVLLKGSFILYAGCGVSSVRLLVFSLFFGLSVLSGFVSRTQFCRRISFNLKNAIAALASTTDEWWSSCITAFRCSSTSCFSFYLFWLTAEKTSVSMYKTLFPPVTSVELSPRHCRSCEIPCPIKMTELTSLSSDLLKSILMSSCCTYGRVGKQSFW